MRSEFEALRKELSELEFNVSVAIAMTNLGKKIDEVEKRLECIDRTANDIKGAISNYTKKVDNNEAFIMSVDNHDSILIGTNDILIATDLEDDEPIENNWYGLFEEKEEKEEKEELKPIAVGKVEYDFPEDVFTIGNADNTEIVCDVYESDFDKLHSLGIIVFEDDDNFPFGKANYIVRDNSFIPIVKLKQIDLSKVPIIKPKVFMTFESSWGEIDCDEDGNVIEIRGDDYINGERNYLYDIGKFDIAEYIEHIESKGLKIDYTREDILRVGCWNKDNQYNPADESWREDDEAPTMLCQDKQKNEVVKDIISKLNEIEVDGETMQYILEQVGMDEQILKQLSQKVF